MFALPLHDRCRSLVDDDRLREGEERGRGEAELEAKKWPKADQPETLRQLHKEGRKQTATYELENTWRAKIE